MADANRDPHSYKPKIEPAYWEAIRDFVRSIVTQCEGHVPYSVLDLYRATTEFSLWGWQSAGLPLDIPGLFDRSIIAYYAQVGCGQLTAAARGNRRSLLLRMAEHLSKAPSTRLPPLPASDPSVPYDRREVVSVMSWARAQSTADRRKNAHVLVCLGLGAGLSAQEIIAVRNQDITRYGPDIDIDITVASGRRRRVPMLGEFAGILPDTSEDADAFAFRPGRRTTYTNAISNFIARGNSSGVRPHTQRMRATWLVRQLNARTPLSVLFQAAGLESLDALARFERFAAPVDPDAAARFLRFAADPVARQPRQPDATSC
ncbi:integrase [Curtobacterium luteum]|nr:site-specific integrase [Curtobacterium luteum]MBM7803321.1 integrase [Curtobacterium luteum]NUU51646.1 site-specific integrase [Curtobacterium luteum]